MDADEKLTAIRSTRRYILALSAVAVRDQRIFTWNILFRGGTYLAEVRVIDVSPYDLRGYISSFVIIDEKVAVVDPGPESSYSKLKEGLEGLGVRPDLIFVTHVHLDHAGAAAHLLADYNSSVVYVHPRGVPHVIDPSKLYAAALELTPLLPQTYGRPLNADPRRVIQAEDGLVVSLGSSSIRVLHTPGHASHHMSLLLEPEGVLFTGDSAGVIFNFGGLEVPMPTSPPPFKPKMYLESVAKMERLSPRKFAPTHFGLHDDAPRWLKLAREQVVRWLEAIRSAGPSSDIQTLENVIGSIEPSVAQLLKSGEAFAVRGFLDTTIMGLKDALERGEWP
jgi:glyoxylase-like metal-dependent hydrolase (beta-lactamase superfamily II)